jgi:hypothetical protein
VQPGPISTYQTSFESSPVVFNGYVYIGDDYGQLFRLTDNPPPVASTSTVAIFDVCSAVGATAPCSSAWAIHTSVAYDTVNSHVYAVANDYVFELPGGGGNWAQTGASPKHLNSGGTGPMTSSPVIDATPNGFIYTAFNSKLFKLTYPFAGSSTTGIYSSSLSNGTGSANPSTDPFPYNDYMYVGDNAGYAERFDCATQTGTPLVDGQTTVPFGTSITTLGVLDYAIGNLYFGYTNGTAGGLVQYPLSTTYSCPSGTHYCNADAGPTSTCTGAGGTNYGDACRACCTGTDCASGSCVNGVCAAQCGTTDAGADAGSCAAGGPNTTVSCTGSVCTYACAAGGYVNCGGALQTTGCTNTQTDPDNCGTCGTSCSNSNIPAPACISGTCGGHCADGFVDCDGNRQTNGCETATSCSSCCGKVCGTGTTCYDPGGVGDAGVGACLTGQTTQTYGTASEESNVTITCPTGQPIAGITFADYGTPNGVPGQSWSTAAICNGLTMTTCNATAGCAWSASASACLAYACSNATTQTACLALTNCAWAPGSTIQSDGGLSLHESTGTCTTATCAAITSSALCPVSNCATFLSSGTCPTASGCGWDPGTGTCGPVCAWDSALTPGVCTGAFGYQHNYGTYTTSGNTCAMDVGASTTITNICNQFANTCTYNSTNGAYLPGNSTIMGTNNTPYPLSGLPPYDNNPCNGVYKRVDLQATCGTCNTGSKRIFVSTTTSKGNFGALTNADAFCNNNASNANLPGTYMAWISNSTTGAAARFTTQSTSPYYLPDGTEVAANFTALLNTATTPLLHAINQNAAGTTVTTPVWTDTSATGTTISGESCSDWTSTSGSTFGEEGLVSSTGTAFTASTAVACSTGLAFYCLEQ